MSTCVFSRRMYLDSQSYVDMDLYDDGTGYWTFSGYGWFWSGDAFVLGLVRFLNNFSVEAAIDFLRGVDWEAFVRAIRNSLEINPCDGIYAVAGDNVEFHFSEGMLKSAEESEYYYLVDELEHAGVKREMAGWLLDEVWFYTPSADDYLSKIESEFGERWKKDVLELLEKCECGGKEEDSIKLFVEEMQSLIERYKAEIEDYKFELGNEGFRKALEEALEEKGLSFDEVMELAPEVLSDSGYGEIDDYAITTFYGSNEFAVVVRKEGKLWADVFSNSKALDALEFVKDVVNGVLEEGVRCDELELIKIAMKDKKLSAVPAPILKQVLVATI